MWKNYNVNTTKEKIIEAANKKSPYANFRGDFINTDGAWCATRTTQDFKEMLEHFFGFEVISCKEKDGISAEAITKCGLKLYWNGLCTLAEQQ